MRSPTASLAAMLLVAAVSSIDGCANRGMIAPSDGGAGGTIGSTGGGGGNKAGSGGAAGQHGSGGSGGRGGTIGGTGGLATGGSGTGGTATGGSGTGGTATGGTAGHGTGGTTGTGGTPTGGQGGHGGGQGGHAGGGGAGGGKGGGGGSPNRDAGAIDAPVDHPNQCKALFNFESGTQGAMLGTNQQAFTQLAVSSADTFCGNGALALTAAFSGTIGATTLGEVVLPLGVDGGTVDLTGKTLTVNAAASGASGTNVKMTVVVITSAGSFIPISDVFLSSSWTIKSAALAGDGVDSVVSIAIDVSSFTGYTGTVYLDEIDIR